MPRDILTRARATMLDTLQGVIDQVEIPGIRQSTIMDCQLTRDTAVAAVKCTPVPGYGEDIYKLSKNGQFTEVRVFNYHIEPSEEGGPPIFHCSMIREMYQPYFGLQCSAKFLSKLSPTRSPKIVEWRKEMAAEAENRPAPGDVVIDEHSKYEFTVVRVEGRPRALRFRTSDGTIYGLNNIRDRRFTYLHREPRTYDRALILAPSLGLTWMQRLRNASKYEGHTEQEKEFANRLLLLAARKDQRGVSHLSEELSNLADRSSCPSESQRLLTLLTFTREWISTNRRERCIAADLQQEGRVLRTEAGENPVPAPRI